MLHLKNRYTEYKSLFSISSFNHLYINRILFNIRNNIKYIFYYLIKKTIFLRLFHKYKILQNINKYIKIGNTLSNFRKQSMNIYSICILKSISGIFMSNSLLNTLQTDLICSSYIASNIYINSKSTLIFRKLNNILFMYRNYIFMIYIWLYSLKFLNYYKLTYSNSKTSRKRYTVLRSPHKDKKSREQFKINKLKKHIILPTFICNNINYIFGSLVNEAVLVRRYINKNVI